MPSARTAFPDLDREEARKLSSASPALPAHSSRGPGRRPLTAVTRVRIPYALPNGEPTGPSVRLSAQRRRKSSGLTQPLTDQVRNRREGLTVVIGIEIVGS